MKNQHQNQGINLPPRSAMPGSANAAALAVVAIVVHAKLVVYTGAPHGLTETHKTRVTADLLAFARRSWPTRC